ncbi:MAG: ComEC family competence protein [Bacteroidales bacterium]|nr:ComEC family competence protein [Bacteroidales bacterium]
MNWNKYPFIRLVAALSLGILLHEVGEGVVSVGRLWLFVGFLTLVAGLVVLHRMLTSFRYRWIHGVAAILVLVYVGYCRADFQETGLRLEQSGQMMHNDWCMARLYEPPTEREKTIKVILEIVGFENDDGVTRVDGKVMAYFQKTDEALALTYGDILAFQAPIEPVAPPKNPEEFDYRAYLERRGVTGSVYLKEGDWIPTGVKKVNVLYAFAYRFRDRMMEAMRQCGIEGDEFGVGAAILLGYDDSLPAQVRHNYVAAGSMHILCVSGMHVGTIYLLASFLLGLLGRGKAVRLFKRIVLLLLIWFYALVTGLSPSIMRSALMISMILFGEIIHRKGFTLNSIAASAFVLLLIDPNNLFAIGFQLSYAAVVGIVLLQKPLSNLVFVKNKFLDKVWEITTVSIAAQIATMPFAIYYFNQFTPYFWMSNLLMTPLSFVVILSGMTLLIFSWVPHLNVFLGKIVWLGLRGMNEVASGIERMPHSLVKGLYMDEFQFVLSLVLLLLLWLFVNLRKKRLMMELLALLSVFALSMAWRVQRASQQSVIMCYSVRNHTALVVAQGFNSVMLCDEGLLAEPSSIDYSLKGHWARYQLSMNPSCFTLDEDFSCWLAVKCRNLLSAQGMLLAVWDPTDAVRVPQPIKVDYLLVRGKQSAMLREAMNLYQIGTLLVDNTVPDDQAREWIQQAEAVAIPCHDLRDGAMVLSLKQ